MRVNISGGPRAEYVPELKRGINLMNKCDGCEYEFEEAVIAQDIEGHHYATTIDKEYDGRKHFFILMVDDDGCIRKW